MGGIFYISFNTSASGCSLDVDTFFSGKVLFICFFLWLICGISIYQPSQVCPVYLGQRKSKPSSLFNRLLLLIRRTNLFLLRCHLLRGSFPVDDVLDDFMDVFKVVKHRERDLFTFAVGDQICFVRR